MAVVEAERMLTRPHIVRIDDSKSAVSISCAAKMCCVLVDDRTETDGLSCRAVGHCQEEKQSARPLQSPLLAPWRPRQVSSHSLLHFW